MICLSAFFIVECACSRSMASHTWTKGIECRIEKKELLEKKGKKGNAAI